MEILKKGIIVPKQKKFTCEYCGCIFIANETEYEQADQVASIKDGITAYCKCPTCNRTAYCYK